MRERPFGRNLLSGYAPNSFLKPVMLISTVFGRGKKDARSTAICFGHALNRHHLMEKVFAQEKCYERAGWGDPRVDVSKFIVIKKHKTWKDAYMFHVKLSGEMNWENYHKLFYKYCPKKYRESRTCRK